MSSVCGFDRTATSSLKRTFIENFYKDASPLYRATGRLVALSGMTLPEFPRDGRIMILGQGNRLRTPVLFRVEVK